MLKKSILLNFKKILIGGGKTLVFCTLWTNICFSQEKFEPLISIVLPTYNRAELLERSIDSLLNQTYQNIEIIVVDDASTDSTLALLKKYQKKSDKIKVITHSKNQGVAQARNTGNAHARGDYIAIMDSDDYASEDWIKTSVDFIKNNKDADILIPLKQSYTREDLSDIQKIHQNHHFFIFGNSLGNVGNLFKRDFIIKHNISYPTDYICGEDYHFWMQMILNGAKIRSIETKKTLVTIRTHETNGADYKKACKQALFDVRKLLTDKIGISITESKNTCLFSHAYVKKYPNTLNAKDKETLLQFGCSNIHNIQYKKRRFFIF